MLIDAPDDVLSAASDIVAMTGCVALDEASLPAGTDLPDDAPPLVVAGVGPSLVDGTEDAGVARVPSVSGDTAVDDTSAATVLPALRPALTDSEAPDVAVVPASLALLTTLDGEADVTAASVEEGLALGAIVVVVSASNKCREIATRAFLENKKCRPISTNQAANRAQSHISQLARQQSQRSHQLSR